MSAVRTTATMAAGFILTLSGLVVAQDDGGFEALLQEISQPSPTQQPVAAAAAPAQVAQLPEEEPLAATSETMEVEASEPVFEPAVAVETEAPAADAGDLWAQPVEEPAAAPTDGVETPATEEVAAPVHEDPFAAAAAAPDVLPAAEPAAAPVYEDPFAAAAAAPDVLPAAEPAAAPVYEDPFAAAAAAPDVLPAAEPAATPVYEDPFAAAMEQDVEPPAADGTTDVVATAEADADEGEHGAPAKKQEVVTGLSAKQLAKNEEIRRQERELRARKTLDSGLQSAASRDYDKAIKDLAAALTDLPDRPSNKALRDQARASLADAHYRKAQAILDANGSLSAARASAESAKQYGNRHADDLLKKIAREEERQAELAKRRVPVKARSDFVQKQKTIQDYLVEGRDYFKNEDYNAAELAFEQVLLKDEYNIEAMRFLKKIDELRYKARTREREATEADMMQKVRDAWNPPIRQDVKLPDSVVEQTAIEKKSAAQKLQEKMEQITFPLIDFRSANIIDVVKFLNDESANLDKEGVGVNIILKLGASGGMSSAPAPTSEPASSPFGGGGEDIFGAPTAIEPEPFAAPTQDFGGGSSSPTITLSLRRVTLLNAIKYITEVAGLKFRIDEDAVIITPEGVVQGRVVTRLYPVQPTFLDVVIDKGETQAQGQDRGDFIQMGSSSATIKKADVKEFFERSGVPFPAGTSITFNPGISQLIVANTPENLEIFERILAQLNVVPNQVEIEARFVEIGQDDLEELGMQWILTDNYEFAMKKGNGPVTGRERMQVNKDTEGFTKGLRFFEFGQSGDFVANSAARNLNPVGDVATIASVLTNPELKVVIQALSQHGGSDLLSAPRVTTRSGVNAQIQVVREIIYPTEFETTQPQFSSSSGDTQIVTPPLVTPGTFETRETGVILNVTPTVGPDGYTIDLTLVPEVTELVDWINYGSTFGDFTFNIPQPVFATRKVTTSIVIWDGQTVVMGGLIREDLVKIKDKIPLLGDIPLIGRLFRSEGQYSKKKNLLIFVTARLVDPAGKTIHKAGEVGAGEGAAPAADTKS